MDNKESFEREQGRRQRLNTAAFVFVVVLTVVFLLFIAVLLIETIRSEPKIPETALRLR